MAPRQAGSSRRRTPTPTLTSHGSVGAPSAKTAEVEQGSAYVLVSVEPGKQHLPLRDPVSRERTIGELLDLLVGANAGSREHTPAYDH